MDELGWVLMNHDLITRNEPNQQHANGNRPNNFKFNMERLRNLLEQHEQNNHAELTSKKQNKFLRLLSEIRHVTTVERMLKHAAALYAESISTLPMSIPVISKNCMVRNFLLLRWWIDFRLVKSSTFYITTMSLIR
ncbi:uncharacterized protein LOC129777814 [Toxorhynchites rutilus septentrionalis]|uniref:uncharacterized protein LOC129777814 n=1 Tax=Toxorhynchites rutilus septentrionalis TaxID=329112 RepID=UPI0024791851|nr:uncharacterized protein LOC129777814 [Toxorhynchites rutilus septentrionalis]